MTGESALDAFAARIGYPLDAFQRSACERLEEGRSVLVAAPTGSGKTTVAEFAVYLARRERDARIFYTAPIKALSNQKFHELCEEYGEDEVGLLTGDVNLRGDAPIVVMTTEVLRNMIYAEGGEDSGGSRGSRAGLDGLAFVVLDEVHYLGDRWRGAVWEEIILHLPREVRLVSLSATVSNAEEFGDWMHAVRGDTDVILSEHRPVPLYQHVLTSKALLPLYVGRDGETAATASGGRLNPELRMLDGRGYSRGGGRGDRDGGGRGHGERGRGGQGRDERDRGNGRGQRRGGRSHGYADRGRARGGPPLRRSRRVSRADIARALDETGLLPAIVFVFSRNGCDQAVRQCLFEGIALTSREEREEIRRIARSATRDMSDEERRVLGVREWVAGLERGIAAHHAGLLPTFKTVVEQLFQRRLVKLVFATETLALGINMPARAVVIERLDKFNGEQRVPLTSGEYTQLTGRAGRRGIDTEGHAVVVWNDGVDLEALAHLAGARSFPVRSSFRPTPNMAVNLLQRMDTEQVRETLELSFAQFQADRAVVDQARELRAEQESLAGYDAAAARAQGADRKRWEDRARKLRRRIERGRRQIASRTGTIARTFDRVVDLLFDLDYLEGPADEPEVAPWGELLRRIYGERDLLVAECLRRDALRGLDAAGLAAMCCVLSYEPRRDDEGEPRLPGGRLFADAHDRVLDLWVELDDLFERYRLPRSEMPHAGLASAMHSWASGTPIEVVLERSGIGAGDFVRWAKQTIDLLDQIAQACETAVQTGPAHAPAGRDAGAGRAAGLDEDRLGELAKLAREAKRGVRRGIVEASSAS
ncbi:DEAD/DEAH box helicase [Leucobacter tenebrionis]|uniref:DEAD/DEAH box helicase n=1 Tax=Leucobacter tenebrionis TaxID=2873270 RepID=UPI001CA697EA|nr:DEAD/DEAH box helicase [Leucobacter tenebrionis]QZY51988.1 DEAD/DEAH box helicase [Leucobacter tenebrionis]